MKLAPRGGQGIQSDGHLRCPCSCPTCTIHSGKLFLRKRSRFLELIGSLVVAVLAEPHAILSIVWKYQEELSSTAACPRPDGNAPIARGSAAAAFTTTGAGIQGPDAGRNVETKLPLC